MKKQAITYYDFSICLYKVIKLKLILDIFLGDHYNYDRKRCNLPLFYYPGVCELTYNGINAQRNDINEFSYSFPVWDTIQVEINNELKIEQDEFFEVGITPQSYLRFCVLKSDINKLKDFCDKRNQEMLSNKKAVYNYINTEILNIAENLLNIAEENIMLNYRIVARCHINYSHTGSKIFNRNSSIINEYKFSYDLFKNTHSLKGKAKKDAEKFNDELRKKINEFSKLIDNFVEIIIEEKKINEYVAKAVAWEAIQRKAIDYYSQQWKEEYEINLTESFSDFDAHCINMDNPKAVNAVKRNYIKSVLLCNEIDIEHSQEILMYFLLSKRNIDELILCDCFIEHYEIIKELQQNIDSSDIKQKLKTKQQRKISKYTIDDIDLMTGTEFEEFIALLFKKMGYSSQVTKQSGDQGIDVIAIKNNTRIGIQAKCYSNAVGNAAIQEAVAGKNFYNCDKTVVVTNNYFTTAAIDLAQANNVILWNRDLLKEKIKELL